MNEDIVGMIMTALAFVSVSTVLPICIVYMRRTERMKSQQTLPVPDVVARLERMETVMETMSAEIERIGEGQRFTTKLLSSGDTAAESIPRALPRSGVRTS